MPFLGWVVQAHYPDRNKTEVVGGRFQTRSGVEEYAKLMEKYGKPANYSIAPATSDRKTTA